MLSDIVFESKVDISDRGDSRFEGKEGNTNNYRSFKLYINLLVGKVGKVEYLEVEEGRELKVEGETRDGRSPLGVCSVGKNVEWQKNEDLGTIMPSWNC